MATDTIVRDVKDYPDADAARASLPPIYANHPYAGVWLQPGDTRGEHEVYVFSEWPAEAFAEMDWELITAPE